MRPESFAFLQDLLHRETGVVMDDGKEYLVLTRLRTVVKGEGLSGVDELVELLRSRPHHPLRRRTLETLITTETSFFRDVRPFTSLKEVLIPLLVERRASIRTLRFWSAACSTGQEPYSLAMLIREHFSELDGWRIKILASDVSSEVLERARTGSYSQMEVNRGVPTPLLMKYFRREGLNWVVNEEIRRMVDFVEINLAGELPKLPEMDIIFLRNVLIYFRENVRRRVLERVARLLRSDGYLFVGGAETLITYQDLFERVQIANTSCFRPRR